MHFSFHGKFVMILRRERRKMVALDCLGWVIEGLHVFREKNGPKRKGRWCFPGCQFQHPIHPAYELRKDYTIYKMEAISFITQFSSSWVYRCSHIIFFFLWKKRSKNRDINVNCSLLSDFSSTSGNDGMGASSSFLFSFASQ